MIFLKHIETLLSLKEYSNYEIESFNFALYLSKLHSNEKLQEISFEETRELLDRYIDETGIDQTPLYDSKMPIEHNAVPQSLFALPIASMANAGESLNKIDQKPFQTLAKKVGLNLTNVKLGGEILCPKQDMPVLTASIQELLKTPVSSFARYSEDGEILNEGEVISIDYWSILDKALISVKKNNYSKNWYSRSEMINQFQASLNRILALRLSWTSPSKNKVIGQPLISFMNFDAESFTLNIRPTYALYQLFKDDRVLRLNRELMNVPQSNVEMTLLNYISSLRHHFSSASDQPLKLIDPIMVIDLILRCYPESTEEELQPSSPVYKSRRSVVTKAMKKLQDENLISFEETTFKRKRQYINVLCNVGLKTQSFLDMYKAEPLNYTKNIKDYLVAYPLPRSRIEATRKAYAIKHLPRMVSIAGYTESEIRTAFIKVSTNTVGRIENLAKEHGVLEAIEMIEMLKSARAKKVSLK